MTGPLQDLPVVDCTIALAGPFESLILADLGADVIKVENPSTDSRELSALSEEFGCVMRFVQTSTGAGSP